MQWQHRGRKEKIGTGKVVRSFSPEIFVLPHGQFPPRLKINPFSLCPHLCRFPPYDGQKCSQTNQIECFRRTVRRTILRHRSITMKINNQQTQEGATATTRTKVRPVIVAKDTRPLTYTRIYTRTCTHTHTHTQTIRRIKAQRIVR